MPLIGNDFLSQFRMVIDYASHELLLTPYEDARFERNSFSAGLRPGLSDEKEAIVEGVWEGSPADLAGIEVGDRIVSFDSREVTQDNLIDLINLLKDDAVPSVAVEILHMGDSTEVSLEKAMLF
jgi:S1-C subfamily serine protease